MLLDKKCTLRRTATLTANYVIPCIVFTQSDLRKALVHAMGCSDIKFQRRYGAHVKYLYFSERMSWVFSRSRHVVRSSVLFDEWTSSRNGRHMNVSDVDEIGDWNLSFTRSTSTMPAWKTVCSESGM